MQQTTQLTRVEAFARRIVGFDDGKVVVFSDDTEAPGVEGFSLPEEQIFEAPFPFPAVGEFTWFGIDFGGPTLEPGTYWLALVTNTDSDFAGEITWLSGKEGLVANHRQIEIQDDQGTVIGHILEWDVAGSASGLSVRIHGEAVPEPGTASLLLTGVLAASFRLRQHRQS